MSDISQQTDDDLAAIDILMAEALAPTVMRERYGTCGPGRLCSLCLVIREDGETVGSLRFWEVMLGDQTILLLGPLAVRPELRGRGLGQP